MHYIFLCITETSHTIHSVNPLYHVRTHPHTYVSSVLKIHTVTHTCIYIHMSVYIHIHCHTTRHAVRYAGPSCGEFYPWLCKTSLPPPPLPPPLPSPPEPYPPGEAALFFHFFLFWHGLEAGVKTHRWPVMICHYFYVTLLFCLTPTKTWFVITISRAQASQTWFSVKHSNSDRQ